MRIKFSFKTDIGRKKTNNEDSYYYSETSGLFGIADGMGGHAGGEVASKIAADIIKKCVESAGDKLGKLESIPAFISNIVIKASDSIKEEARRNPLLAGMGTTIVQMLCLEDKIYVSNVGDSRCYKLSDLKEFSQVSHDHSQIQEYIDDKIITEEQAKTHPMRHIITQAVGYSENLNVRTVVEPYKAGDYYLLCSDGLNDHFASDAEVKELFLNALEAGSGDLDAVCAALVDKANDLGGRDNITVMVLKILE